MEEYESLPELPVPAGLVSAPDPFYLTGRPQRLSMITIFSWSENAYEEARQDIEN